MPPTYLLALLLAFAAPVHAIPHDLYAETVIVTGRDDLDERARGIREALPRVLARVAGDRALLAAQVPAGIEPEALVRSLDYVDRKAGIQISDEQGTRDRSFALGVGFAPEAIDRLLVELGRAPWSTARPPLAVHLVVADGVRTFAVTTTSEQGWGQRAALEDAAVDVGLAAHLEGDPGFEWAAARLDGRMSITASGHWDTIWTLAASGRRWRWEAPATTFDRAIADGLWGAAERLRP